MILLDTYGLCDTLEGRLNSIREQSCLHLGTKVGRGKIRALLKLADKRQQEASRDDRVQTQSDSQ